MRPFRPANAQQVTTTGVVQALKIAIRLALVVTVKAVVVAATALRRSDVADYGRCWSGKARGLHTLMDGRTQRH